MTDITGRIADIFQAIDHFNLFVIAKTEDLQQLKNTATTIRDQNFFIELAKVRDNIEKNRETPSFTDKRELGTILTEYIKIESFLDKVEQKNRHLIILKPMVISLSFFVLSTITLKILNLSGKVAGLFPPFIFTSPLVASGTIFVSLFILCLLVVGLAMLCHLQGEIAVNDLKTLMMDYPTTIAESFLSKNLPDEVDNVQEKTSQKLEELAATQANGHQKTLSPSTLASD